MEIFLLKSVENLRKVIEHHFYLGNCSKKEKAFLLSNTYNYVIPHFYIIWKILKKIIQSDVPLLLDINGFLLSRELNFWKSVILTKIVVYSQSTSKAYTHTFQLEILQKVSEHSVLTFRMSYPMLISSLNYCICF